MSFQWPTKGRVRALLALGVVGAAIWNGLVDKDVLIMVLAFYFGSKAASDAG